MEVTAVFDIGKTNKKFFLFDKNYQEVFKEYTRFEEIRDDEGFPADNLEAIEQWLKTTFAAILKTKKFKVHTINFSSYGASFVLIDKNGKRVTPLYNYTKPFPDELLKQFYEKHGNSLKIAKETSSPPLGMLNSGLQLYWLKYAKPEEFKQIKHALHLPQYLSWLFTGLPLSEYTSIGCHTGLWDFEKGDYHDWVYAEEIDRILPTIVDTDTSINMDYLGNQMKIGVGIHDSSAALLPYLNVAKNPFLLISTGTWSIALNPYSEEPLDEEDLKNDCLNFMRVDGKTVKAARLFLGNEHKLQVTRLNQHFQKEDHYYHTLKFDKELFLELKRDQENKFCFESLSVTRDQPEQTLLSQFENFEQAYHQMMLELMELQVAAAKRAIGNTSIKKIYVDGGFADNETFIKLLSYHFQDYKIRTTKSPLGSALGAAMAISENKIDRKFLKKHYAMKKHSPLILVNESKDAIEI